MNSLILFLSLWFDSSNFCSCSPLRPIDEKQYNEYSLILKGRVTKVTEQGFDRKIFVIVKDYYKGTEKNRTIIITSPSQSGMCGIFPKPKEDWLIFANLDGGNYRTSLCTRAKNMNSKAWNFSKDEIEADIKFLEAKRTSANP